MQVPFKTDPGKIPRKIEIDRKKRSFAKKDLVALLADRGVDVDDLMPPLNDFAMRKLLNADKDHGVSTAFPAFLPLDVFDDTEYDSRMPNEWLDLSPAPGKALLPAAAAKKNGGNANAVDYEWKDVAVVDLDASTNLFRVRLEDENDDKTMFEVPRIRLLFAAEDPENFANRVEAAFRARAKTEALLRYNLYIDCMPTDDVQELDKDSMKRMLLKAKSTVSLQNSEE